MNEMTAKRIIEMALAYCEMPKTELARRLGWSPQLLNRRLLTGKLSVPEWQRIAEALDASLKIDFVFPNGKAVGL